MDVGEAGAAKQAGHPAGAEAPLFAGVGVSGLAAAPNLSLQQRTVAADPAHLAAGQQNVADRGDQKSGSAALSISMQSPSVPAAGKALPAVQKFVSSGAAVASSSAAAADGSTLARQEKRQRTDSTDVAFNFLTKNPGLDPVDKDDLQEVMSHSLQHVRQALSRVVQGSQPSEFHVTMLVYKGDPASLRCPAIVSSTGLTRTS